MAFPSFPLIRGWDSTSIEEARNVTKCQSGPDGTSFADIQAQLFRSVFLSFNKRYDSDMNRHKQ